MIVIQRMFSGSRFLQNAGVNPGLFFCRILKHGISRIFLLFFPFAAQLCAQSGGLEHAAVPAAGYDFLWAGNPDLGFYEYCELRGSYPKNVQLPGLEKLCLKNPRNFHGLRLLLEPAIARLNFHNDLPYRDTWMGGVYAGVDFNPYLGFRGFLFKAMNDGKIKLDFDKLYLYGGEFRLRPNIAKGLTPNLMLGGGYLRVNDRYKPRDGESRVGNQFFAQCGFGLTVPLSDCLHIVGGARTIFSSNSNAARNSHVILTSCMYNFGIRLAIGKKPAQP